jgi:hypothetical protein
VSAEVDAKGLLAKPSVDVETHNVLVPVERRTCPMFPVLFTESRNPPVTERFVVVALDIRILFITPVIAVNTFE